MPGPPQFRGWFAAIIASALIGGGVARAQSAVPEAQLETFLGLNPPSGLNSGDLTNLGNGPVTSGSAIMQSITVSAGATLTFDYNFLTNAPPPSVSPLGALDPFAFITAANADAISPIITSVIPRRWPRPLADGLPVPDRLPVLLRDLLDGGYVLAGRSAVANVTTDAYSSGLLLDNMTLTGGTINNGLFSTGDFTGFSTIGNTSIQTAAFGISPTNGTYQALISTASVPEPSSVVLLFIGGLGAAAIVRRRKGTVSAISP